VAGVWRDGAITLWRLPSSISPVFKPEAKETRMGIAVFTVGAMLTPLRVLLGGLIRDRVTRDPRPTRSLASAAPPLRPGRHRALPVASAHGRALRPLRVVRVAEPLRAPASAGRMVISGRMADVCAELDRLVALETPGVRH
jgi:hypothetical protein